MIIHCYNHPYNHRYNHCYNHRYNHDHERHCDCGVVLRAAPIYHRSTAIISHHTGSQILYRDWIEMMTNSETKDNRNLR